MNGTSNLSEMEEKVQYDELWPEEKVIIYFTLMVIMTIVGVTGNALVLAVPICDKKMRVPANVFIVNLAIADMVVSAVSNPFTLVALVHGEVWFLERWLFCEIIGDMCMTACTASLANIFMVALNRYVAVCHHQYYNRIYTWHKTIWMAGLVWLFCFLIVVPTNHLGWVGNVFDPRYMVCILDQHKDRVYNYLFMFCLVAMPVAIIAIFYLRIFLAIRGQKSAVAAAQGTAVVRDRNVKAKRDDARLARTLFISYAVFVTCWTPYGVSLLTDIDLDVWSPHLYMMVVLLVHGSSSGLNSIIYAATNTNFRHAYLKAIAVVCPAALVGSQLRDSAAPGPVSHNSKASTKTTNGKTTGGLTKVPHEPE